VVDEKESNDTRKKNRRFIYLLVAFAIATKFHLRDEPINPEIKDFISLTDIKLQYEQSTAKSCSSGLRLFTTAISARIGSTSTS
jgi:predicted membrane chloride channel (bestrophin family)